MTNQSGNLPGTTAPQAQLARLKKRLTSLNSQLERLSDRADASKDENLKRLVHRAKANAVTAMSLGDAVDNIAGKTALDLLVAPNSDVQVNVAVTAFDDVPEMSNLRLQATATAPVVLQDDDAPPPATGLEQFQPKRFSCCSPDPNKWFEQEKDSGNSTSSDGTNGNNTCEKPSYLMLTLPVGISTSKERVDEFLLLGDALVTAAKDQVGQAREALCHLSGEETCSLF